MRNFYFFSPIGMTRRLYCLIIIHVWACITIIEKSIEKGHFSIFPPDSFRSVAVIVWMTYVNFAFFLFNAFFVCLLYAYEYKNS